ncbi:hypothetical protein ACIQXI_01995 [Lysinibacillus sp. NPDC097195]|uniref:hypothetical protein n=1 Tax=Lysinibacillus sp. NPDC097195 TaxID=3364141 RepID=UPI00380D433F
MMIEIFWLCYLGFLAIALIGIFLKEGYKTSFGIVDFVFSLITWIGLFCYVAHYQFLPLVVWKLVFIFGLLFDVGYSYKKFNEEVRYDGEPFYVKLAIFGITLSILIGPLYVGLFNYAFK